MKKQTKKERVKKDLQKLLTYVENEEREWKWICSEIRKRLEKLNNKRKLSK